MKNFVWKNFHSNTPVFKHKKVQDVFLEVGLDLEEMQKDLDEWLNLYNCERTHTGKYCYGKTPMETHLDSLELAKSKMVDTLAGGEVILSDSAN